MVGFISYFERRACGPMIFDEPDPILKILGGKIQRSLLKYDESYSLENLWPFEAPSAMYDDFPNASQGYSQTRIGWNIAFQEWVDNHVRRVESSELYVRNPSLK